MSDGSKDSKKKRASTAEPAKPAPDKSAATPVKAVPTELPPMDEHRLSFAEMKELAPLLEPSVLLSMYSDGRATVRANAAVACAVLGEVSPNLLLLARDSDTRVALTAAETIDKLRMKVGPHLQRLVTSMEHDSGEVTEAIVVTLGKLITASPDELMVGFDVPEHIARKTILAACDAERASGHAWLMRAAKHVNPRVRLNAVLGLELFTPEEDIPRVTTLLEEIEADDPVPDLRERARTAIRTIFERFADKEVGADPLPRNVPDYEERSLGSAEIAEHADRISVAQIIASLEDGRKHVRINGSRALAAKGAGAADAVPTLTLLLRDSFPQVRLEAAKTFGKLGDAAVAGAAGIVMGCGDDVPEVADACMGALSSLGSKVEQALFDGLDAGEEAHGRRIAKLVSDLPNASDLLCRAFTGPKVNAQVNAARGIALLGPRRGARGLQLLEGARTGGDVRTREAVFEALGALVEVDTGPPPIRFKGFDSTYLTTQELEKSASGMRLDSLMVALGDGSPVVRANACTALQVVGASAESAVPSLATRVKDDNARVRVAAVQAIGAMGEGGAEGFDTVVGALGDGEAPVLDAIRSVIRSGGDRFKEALVRGLEVDVREHAVNILELLCEYSDATDLLCDAFQSASVNVQVNAALGLGMLGSRRVGRGMRLLEGARTGGWKQTRDAVFEALDMLAPRESGPPPIKLAGFEDKLLGADAFDASKLRLDSLVAAASDGREIVRANAVTGMGVLGDSSPEAMRLLCTLLRDNDAFVRAAAATSIGKLGEQAARDAASDLVGALGDTEPDVIKAVSAVLGTLKMRAVSALLKGLDTGDEHHASNILALLVALPDASEYLCDAFSSPAVNVQVNAARGLGMLGSSRVGFGRRALEDARTGGDVSVREAAAAALAMLDG